jgi:ElaB/YqjD/DUF883 family membrane-anchored ribosome-binding protein
MGLSAERDAKLGRIFQQEVQMESDVMKTGPEGFQGRRDKLARNIESTATEAGEVVKEAGDRIGSKIQEAKTSLTHAQTALTDTAKQYAEFTDEYVRMNPWKSLGFAAAAGLLIGILLSRR